MIDRMLHRALLLAALLLPVSCAPSDRESSSVPAGSQPGTAPETEHPIIEASVQAPPVLEEEEDEAEEPRPSWIDDPGSYFDPRRPDVPLVVGVGRWRTRTELGLQAARMVAMMDARSRIVAASAGPGTQLEATVETSAGVSRSIVRGRVEGTLRTPTQLAEWYAPDGSFYVLVQPQE